MNNITPISEAKVSYSDLLELAADNNVEGFKDYVGCDPESIDEIGLWYGREVGSSMMVLEYRTPLMVAAMYGSLDVVKLIISLSEADVNRTCSPDGSTALHCAACGGSSNAVDVVKLLLLAGADPSLANSKGLRPFDVINSSCTLPSGKGVLQDLLSCEGPVCQRDVQVSGKSLSSASEAPSSPTSSKEKDGVAPSVSEKKEYPIDPTIPDIKNSIFSTDEFRMYSFKVRPCSRAYSHDWTECPFVHPGENARRRDPRKFHYSCVPCPDFRKGSCSRGDLCEYAHGVFECWLHPAQYRTRLCKDGISCARRVCFFAHTPEELRPLYMSSGSSMVSSPRSAASVASIMDMAAALNLFPGSPSAAAVVSPSPFTQPMSPGNCMSPHSSSAWPQQSIPTLHLPSNNIQNNILQMQMSRLRSSLNARDFLAEELNNLQDMEMEQQQILKDMSCYPHPHFNQPNKTLAPSNLDDLFSAEMSSSSSPRFSDQLAASAMFSPSHKTAVLNHFQQRQSMLSPINTKVLSPNKVDHLHLQPSYGGPSSPGVMSPHGIEHPQSPLSARLSALALREKQHQQLRSLSSRELESNLPFDLVGTDGGATGSPVSSWPNKWESFGGKADWSVNDNELGRLKRSYTVGRHEGEEPDVSWVNSLVKDSQIDSK